VHFLRVRRLVAIEERCERILVFLPFSGARDEDGLAPKIHQRVLHPRRREEDEIDVHRYRPSMKYYKPEPIPTNPHSLRKLPPYAELRRERSPGLIFISWV